MGLILSIETSTDIGSVAVHQGHKLLASLALKVPREHASKLGPAIEEVSSFAGIKLHELDAIAVAKGPGSYTGLRIGVSTAKGLCYALSKPLIAIDTLDIMAQSVVKFIHDNDLICPMLDARRMEVYCKLLDYNFNELIPSTALIVEQDSFLEYLNNSRVFFFGNGTIKCKELLSHPNSIFLTDIQPEAKLLGKLAYAKLMSSEFEDAENFEPLYLKEFFIRNQQQ